MRPECTKAELEDKISKSNRVCEIAEKISYVIEEMIKKDKYSDKYFHIKAFTKELKLGNDLQDIYQENTLKYGKGEDYKELRSYIFLEIGLPDLYTSLEINIFCMVCSEKIKSILEHHDISVTVKSIPRIVDCEGNIPDFIHASFHDILTMDIYKIPQIYVICYNPINPNIW